MSIAPRIQARQSQQLTMTPQLQQAIKLLKLSNIELAAFVEEQLEKNPLLERGTGDENRRGEAAQAEASTDSSEMSLEAPSKAASEALDAPDHAIDSEAREATVTAPAADVGGSVDWSKAGPGGSFSVSSEYDAAANSSAQVTLADHLTGQLSLARLSPRDRLIAEYLIGLVDESGYLREDVADIAARLGVGSARVQSVLVELRGFEPTGVFARDLVDCLSIQLSERDQLDDPMRALLGNLTRLAKHDLPGLARACGVKKDELAAMILRLKALDPKPGSQFATDVALAIEPDVFVKETGTGWAVELNSATLPRVLVNHRYAREISSLGGEDTKEFVTECTQTASWLVKSLDQRAKTILKVASEIIKHQDGFFAYGVDHLRPLKLAQIADAIEMNESTVSRVTSNKFMSTPRGVYELKYFFTTAITSSDGGEGHSAEAVRHKIQILIDEERDGSVLSDDAIVDKLRAQDIEIARRTVAKYREAMGIPSSVVRRRMLRAMG
jgi:RNA polymerase sigma-54 factor